MKTSLVNCHTVCWFPFWILSCIMLSRIASIWFSSPILKMLKGLLVIKNQAAVKLRIQFTTHTEKDNWFIFKQSTFKTQNKSCKYFKHWNPDFAGLPYLPTAEQKVHPKNLMISDNTAKKSAHKSWFLFFLSLWFLETTFMLNLCTCTRFCVLNQTHWMQMQKPSYQQSSEHRKVPSVLALRISSELKRRTSPKEPKSNKTVL